MSDPSLFSSSDVAGVLCCFCRKNPAKPKGRFCGRKCRQAAFRLRRRRTTQAQLAEPGRFCYADPPYPGLAARYYQGEDSFAGEVDHVALIASLTAASYTGWALSTSARALRDILPLCPPEARVCAWVKPHGVSSKTHGIHNAWEPLIVVGGRSLQPGKRDWLRAQPARFGGTLMGRKPLAFCAWLFDLLGMLPGDELVDQFPGTGIVSRAWAELSRLDPVVEAQRAGKEIMSRRPPTYAQVAEQLGLTVEDVIHRDLKPDNVLAPAAPADVVDDASSAPGCEEGSAA